MPTYEHNSATARLDVSELISCAFAPLGNDDLTRKAYVDALVGGLGYFMSQYANPQAAVDAAIASGYKMVFVDDMFTITAPVNFNVAGAVDFTLLGMGQDCGFNVDNAAATGALNITQDDVTIQNLRINVTTCVAAANIILTTGERTRLRDLDIIIAAGQTAAHGVHLSAGSHHRVENVRIDCTGATCAQVFEMGSGTHVILDKVTTLAGAIAIESGAGDLNEIVNCVITDCTSYPIRLNANCTNTAVRGCLIDAPGAALYVQGDDIVIANNEIYNATAQGIRCSASLDRAKIIGNNIYSPGTHGIELDGCCCATVTGNTIYDAGTNGIQVEGTSSRNVVACNGIHTSAGDGIQVNVSSYVVVMGNVIDIAGSNGIETVGACARLLINGNITSNCTTDGVFLSDTTTFSLVVNNQVEDGLTMGTGVSNEHYHNVT